MAKFGLNKRPSYDQIVNYIGSDPVIARYPNRDATIFMNSPQFQNLSNDGSIDLQEQNDNLAKQKQKEELVRERTRRSTETYRISTPRDPFVIHTPPSHYDSSRSEAESDVEMGLVSHGLEREQQRQQATQMGSLLFGGLCQQQSPEAVAAGAAASGSTQYQPHIPRPTTVTYAPGTLLTRDPTAVGWGQVKRERERL